MITITMASHAFASFLISCALINPLLASSKLPEEKELEVVNFQNIQNVLEQDGLSKSVESKKKQVQAMNRQKNEIEKSRFLYPGEDEMWGFLSEYWLVKNAQLLAWDFDKPDYGTDESFKSLLEKLGFFQKRFKVLFINSPEIVRAALPGSQGEMIFLLSVPFVRSLDLSRLEISLLLLEDYLRLEASYFKKNVATSKMKELAGTNFHGKKPDLAMVQEMLTGYDQQVRQKGFTFQQQFEVTRKMDSFLKGYPELWNSYFLMLGKLERFLKSNVQYKDYVRLYPSPEMQVKWLSPEEKVL
jgi:hypothetical protein